jgi:GalNAc-alpha-(1->4)-GalNAc-alpha-(1->3)-diNAcBac-PP-undecaprenol alpha-1,4-N-acetyl-D-galactosaminyltransferase
VSLKAGGTERVVSLLASQLSQEFNTSIIRLVDSESFYEIASTVSIHSPSIRLSRLKPFRTLQQVWHVFRSLKRLCPDVCMIFGEDIAGILCPVARLAAVPRVYVSNRGTPDRSLQGLLGWLNPLFYRLADCVIVQTSQAVDMLKPRYQKCRFEVIANPISIPVQILPIVQRSKRVIYVASVGRSKNQSALISMFLNLPHPNEWKLAFVGDGPERQELESLVRQLGMESKIEFLGQRTDVAELLQDSQIFAFPSLSEGFPNALVEALAAGCACISYDCPTGPADLISDGVNGMLVPVGDESLFTERLQNLIDDESLRVKLSEQARFMIRQYDLPEIWLSFAS